MDAYARTLRLTGGLKPNQTQTIVSGPAAAVAAAAVAAAAAATTAAAEDAATTTAEVVATAAAATTMPVPSTRSSPRATMETEMEEVEKETAPEAATAKEGSTATNDVLSVLHQNRQRRQSPPPPSSLIPTTQPPAEEAAGPEGDQSIGGTRPGGSGSGLGSTRTKGEMEKLAAWLTKHGSRLASIDPRSPRQMFRLEAGKTHKAEPHPVIRTLFQKDSDPVCLISHYRCTLPLV